jgi:hypothetical protein
MLCIFNPLSVLYVFNPLSLYYILNPSCRAASLDSGEVARMMASLNQILALKDEALGDIRFDVVKLAKSFNDSLDTFSAKMVELGIPEDEFAGNGFRPEKLPVGCTPGPAVSLIAQS